MKRWLRYLGFLGFLGVFGFVTGYPGFYGFFNLFGLWALANRKQKSDERVRASTARAGLKAFVVSMVGLSIATAILSVWNTPEAATLSIGGVFTAQLLTFIFSFVYYEKRGNV